MPSVKFVQDKKLEYYKKLFGECFTQEDLSCYEKRMKEIVKKFKENKKKIEEDVKKIKDKKELLKIKKEILWYNEFFARLEMMGECRKVEATMKARMKESGRKKYEGKITFDNFINDWEIQEILDEQLKKEINNPILKELLSSFTTSFLKKELGLLALKKNKSKQEKAKFEGLLKRHQKIEEIEKKRKYTMLGSVKDLTDHIKVYDSFINAVLDNSKGVLSDEKGKVVGNFSLDPGNVNNLQKTDRFIKMKAKELAGTYGFDSEEVYQQILIKLYQVEEKNLYKPGMASRPTLYNQIIRNAINDISRGHTPYNIGKNKIDLGNIDLEQHSKKLTSVDIKTIQAIKKYKDKAASHLGITQTTLRKRGERIRRRLRLK